MGMAARQSERKREIESGNPAIRIRLAVLVGIKSGRGLTELN